ncbi:MAG: gamma-glutamyltransferase [Dehalococcoidia bacterium]
MDVDGLRDWRSEAGALFEPEKKPARGSLGMVVTNNPLGSAAGAQLLAAGGNAIDAAVASLFVLTVVEPMMVGIFGAGMSTIRLAGGDHAAINNYAVAPAAAGPTMYRTRSDTWPDYQEVEGRENDVGPLAVGVPGTLKGWSEMLERHGRFSLAEVMEPAISVARNGFRATRYLHEIATMVAEDLARYPETARTFLPGGAPVETGAVIRQPEYAETLSAIAREGPELLYDGELGAHAVDYLRSIGGLITREDLRNYKTFWAEVVRGSYRGYEFAGPPPPTAGGVHILEMLNILEGFDIRGMGFGTADSIHLLAEILKVGFEDRGKYMGDPAFVDIPVSMLVDKAYAAKRRREIDMAQARTVDTAYHAESPHTTHLTVADAEGNVVAATHTIHAAFGSKVTVPGTGMLLNNTMNIFDPHPGLANSIAPGKRMTSSMSPVILERDGSPFMALGLVGGTRIFPSAFQAIVNVVDHGMSAQEAVEAPRIWTLGEELELESGVPEEVRSELARRGHRIVELPIIGAGMGMIRFDQDGSMTGASCWRADGTPVGLSGGRARSRLHAES